MEIEEVKSNAMKEEKEDHCYQMKQSGLLFSTKNTILAKKKQLLLREENASAHQSATRQSSQSGQGIKLIIQ